MFSGDFVKLTQATTTNGVHHGTDDDWSDTELLRLLEGVEMYDDDWSEIERHVGTRSAQQCIRKFLELPIEDPYIASEGNMGPLRYARVPFEQADNPVMSVVAFLAGVVGPGVAAEAAKTALQELADGGKEAKKEVQIVEGEEQPKDTTAEQAEDKMDEDGAKEASSQAAAGPSSKPSTPKPDHQPVSDEAMAVDAEASTSASQAEKPKTTVPHSKVVRAATLALKASAKTARELADAEERQIKSTLATLIKLTLTKLELKMAQFEELEELLEEERKGLESARMTLVNERLSLKKMLDTVKTELARQTAGDSTPGTLAAAANQAQAALTANGARVSEVPSASIEGDMGPITNSTIAPLA